MAKKCSKCGLLKDESEFYKDRKGKDGLCFDCKKCRLAYNKEYRKKHQRKITAYRKRYYREHRGEIAAWKKKYYLKHKDELKAYQKNYYKEKKKKAT